MRYRLFIIAKLAILFGIVFPLGVFAETDNTKCSPVGYSVFTINGIFTNKEEAAKNKRSLEDKLDNSFNSQPLTVDYLHNPSHIAGLGDLVMSVYQKIFDNETVKDYDLMEILKDASEKVKTQKLLLVAHSQGNFYANSFYDAVAGKNGGVPAESIGVYSVATPAGRVAGGGQWLTSKTDKVIVKIVGIMPFKKIMAPNASIVLAEGDDSWGHNFSGVYLKYRGGQIVSDIQSSLNRLKENDLQDKDSPCLASPELTIAHKIEGTILSAIDPIADKEKNAIVAMAAEAYQAGKTLAKGAYSLAGFIAGSAASAISGDNKNTSNEAGALNAINSENVSNADNSQPHNQSAAAAVEEVLVSNKDQEQEQEKIAIAQKSLNDLQKQLLTLQREKPPKIVLDDQNLLKPSPIFSNLPAIEASQPKFVAVIYPGFGGGGDGARAIIPASGSSSSGAEISSSSSASSSSYSSSTSPVEPSSFSSISSLSHSSSSAPDLTPPTISSFSLSECQQTLSSDGCLIATATATLIWSSPSDDVEYFELTSNGTISTTTATSTILTLADNSNNSFSLRAKDRAGNWSVSSAALAEVSLTPVVINEIAWAGNSAAYSADEWLELYNRTGKTINLSNWTLYSATDLTPYVNLSGAIASKGYYLLERTNDDTVSNIAADKIYTGDLINAGENIVLAYKPAGQATTTIDQVPYCANWCGGSSNYYSMERYDPNSAGTSISNWGTNNSVIRNGKNAGGGSINGTPKARNSVNYLINKGQNVSSNLTLSAANSPYLVDNSVQTFSASSTLTIEPGVTIKFYNDSGLSFISGAKISALGSSASPIIFTSFYDDAYGGDTNGDATSTSPAYGDWFGVRINSPGAESAISHTLFRYGGKYYSGGGWTDSQANLYLANSSANVSDSIFEYAKVYGARLSNASSTFSGNIFRGNNNGNEGGSTGLYSESGTLTANSNTFSNNKTGLSLSNSGSARVDSNTFSANAGQAVHSSGPLGSFSNNSGSNNSVNGIVMSGNITSVNSTTTLGVNFLPYVIKNENATVVASSSLIAPSGTVIKADWRLFVNGQMKIDGVNASDVILTSLYDDTIAGDTTNDGNSILPQAGQGGWIVFSNTGSFTGSGFTARYGGSSAYLGNNSAWLYFDGSGGQVSRAVFDNNYPYGIYAANSPGLIVSDTSFTNHAYNNGSWGTKAALAIFNSTTTLSSVSFLNNALGVLSDKLSAFTVSAITFANNTATTSPGGLW